MPPRLLAVTESLQLFWKCVSRNFHLSLPSYSICAWSLCFLHLGKWHPLSLSLRVLMSILNLLIIALISLLPIISKIFECFVNQQLLGYLEDNDFLTDCHYVREPIWAHHVWPIMSGPLWLRSQYVQPIMSAGPLCPAHCVRGPIMSGPLCPRAHYPRVHYVRPIMTAVPICPAYYVCGPIMSSPLCPRAHNVRPIMSVGSLCSVFTSPEERFQKILHCGEIYVCLKRQHH